MIKNSKLIGTVIDEPFGWKEFKVGDLFDLKNAKAYSKFSDDIIVSKSKNANTPFITTQVANNGIAGYSEFEALNCGNRITYSDTTTGESIFYQEKPYIGQAHVCYMEPKFYEFNKHIAIFIISLIKPQTTGHFDYGKKLNKQAMNDINLILPVTEQGTPDYTFMENYVKELEKVYVENLETSRVQETKNYITVANLSDTTLTPKEQETLDLWRKHKQSLGRGVNP